MYERIKQYIEKYHMITKDDKVIAGVSGGADSICLLFILIRFAKEWGFALHAVHVHHGIRGESADADEAYVRRVCGQEGILCTVFRENVPLYAKEHGLTEEEAGREVRRAAFEKVLKEQKGTKIALAHHMNDNAETLLWNLCRGTALKGLGAIAPVSGVWIRPLLCVKREEIVSYLKKWGISYCTDETNEENVYTRNRIRNDVIPYLKKNINEQVISHMAETAEQMHALSGYIGREVSRLKEECTVWDSSGKLLLIEEDYRKIDGALKGYVLHGIICEAAGYRKNIESPHVQMLKDLLKKQVGRRMSLPYGLTAVRCYEGIRFEKRRMPEDSILPEDGTLPEQKARFRIFEKTVISEAFPKKIYTKWFDYDIIKNTVKMRHREPGDYLTIDKNGNTQKLKQYFINEKIPREMRDRIWLLADGSHIIWVIGYRQNQMYQVTEKTIRILEVEFYGGEDDGRDNSCNAQ